MFLSFIIADDWYYLLIYRVGLANHSSISQADMMPQREFRLARSTVLEKPDNTDMAA